MAAELSKGAVPTAARRLAVALFAGLAGLLVAAAPARASEDDRSFSLSISYGTFTLAEQSPDGGVLGFDYERGLSRAISLRASGGLGLYYGDSAAYSGHAVLGLTYLVDVLEYVPYINLGVGAIAIDGADLDADVYPLLELGAGLDILRSPEFSWGLQARFESFAANTSFLTIGARVTWRWGLF